MSMISEIEKRCLEHLDIDYLPLNDIVREFSGFNKAIPSEEEMKQALIFIKTFIDSYNLRYFYTPGGTILKISSKEVVEWIEKEWRNGRYEDINYGLWFEK